MDIQNKIPTLNNKEMVVVEACVRLVLCDLLNHNEDSQLSFESILHNLNTGLFGEKSVQIENTTWLKNLDALRGILCKINPNESKKDQHRLIEERSHGEKSLEEKEGG